MFLKLDGIKQKYVLDWLLEEKKLYKGRKI